ncbi:hypothetical protein [Qipengyuania aquimaris]|uniref:hypothetical protein n=1 Tax=Qipengyuania aquimaris TaxID=255984 RepID=UPI001CD64F72|nr:hypothetical protein [Qipengyuania aquimaris]MCA0904528.1 hypothetical protein [Qipengyuania aquimaris]
MSRKLLYIYAAISSFAVLTYVSRGGGTLEPGQAAAAIFFVVLAGPVIKWWWDERDKALQRRRIEQEKAKEDTE